MAELLGSIRSIGRVLNHVFHPSRNSNRPQAARFFITGSPSLREKLKPGTSIRCGTLRRPSCPFSRRRRAILASRLLYVRISQKTGTEGPVENSGSKNDIVPRL